jgi:hypothetical protein
MKAIILTPAFSHARHELQRSIQRSGIPWLPLYEHSDLPRARSVLLEQGLAHGAERLILIDADTIPTPSGLAALAAHPGVSPHSAVWGMYPLREGDRWSVNPEDPGEASRAIEAGLSFPIRTGGLGFCAIHRESLVRLGEELPTITEDTGAEWRPFCVPFVRPAFGSKPATYYADDGSLCVRLRESGTALWCDSTLRAGHAVTMVLTAPRG